MRGPSKKPEKMSDVLASFMAKSKEGSRVDQARVVPEWPTTRRRADFGGDRADHDHARRDAFRGREDELMDERAVADGASAAARDQRGSEHWKGGQNSLATHGLTA